MNELTIRRKTGHMKQHLATQPQFSAANHTTKSSIYWRRGFSVVKWSLLTIVVLFLALVAIIVFEPRKLINYFANNQGTAAIGRQLSIDGPVNIGWDWTTPSIHLGNVRLANLPDKKDAYMVDIDAIDAQIKIWNLLEGQLNLPVLTFTKPHFVFEKYADGAKNWDLPTLSKASVASKAVLPSHRSNFPILGVVTINDGELRYRDAIKNMDLDLSIESAKGNDAEKGNFVLAGQGKLQNQTFKIDAVGGSLDLLRNSNVDYPLDLHVDMGATHVAVKGTYKDPVQFKDMDATLSLVGDNLADLFYLTAIPLPPTPHYSLSGHLTKNNDDWAFENFKGSVGQSDLNGNLHYDTTHDRGVVKADLTSHLLRMEDLRGLVGGKTQTKEPPAAASDRLLPDVPIDLGRLRSADMDITLNAEHIDDPGYPLDNLNIRFNLQNGVLKLDPFSFGVAHGKVSGPIVLDGTKDVPHVSTDLLLHKLSLQPFFSDSRFAAFSKGHFGGRVKVEGDGKSLAQVLADGNGQITLMMSGGTVSKLIVDAAGLDFGKATPALLGKDETTDIRCVIGDFGMKNGLLSSNIFVVDTTESQIDGNATINLKDETINGEIEAHPKNISLSARTPITIDGKLRKPSIGLDPKELAARGGIAGALALLNPLAAIIPFIEPGLGEDSDCHALIDEARARSGAAAPPAADPQKP